MIPTGARVIDGRVKFLVPGFIEMHAHLSKTRASSLGLFIANGVTTVRDMGGDHEELLRWRQEIRSGKRVGPKVADLVLLDANPLQDIRNTRRIAAVFVRGALYDAHGIKEFLESVRAAPDRRVDDWGRKSSPPR